MSLEIELCLIKDDGKLIGFSMVAGPETNSEYFCARFPAGLSGKKSDITFKGNQVTFEHESEGKCSFELTTEDAKALNNLLNVKGPYKGKKLGLYKDGFLTPGFKITLEGMEDSGKKQPAIMPV